MARRFRFRVRPGSAFFVFGGGSYHAGNELVADEELAAKILRLGRRSVKLLEVIEEQPRGPRKKLPG